MLSVLRKENKAEAGLSPEEVSKLFNRLKRRNPEFFSDRQIEACAFHVVNHLREELRPLAQLEQFNIVVGILTLMADMGRAGALAAGNGKLKGLFATFNEMHPKWKQERDSKGA